MTQAYGSDMAASPDEWNGLFARVGSELRMLAEAVNNLQHFLTPLVGRVVDCDNEAMMRLQDLDLLEQSLHGLSDLMSCLDASTTLTDVGALASEVKTMRLAGMARRLSSTIVPERGAPTEASVLELF